MLSNKELYGRDMPPIPAHVADFRIKVLEDRLGELTKVHFMSQDIHLINRVHKAITFWNKLKNGEDDEINS